MENHDRQFWSIHEFTPKYDFNQIPLTAANLRKIPEYENVYKNNTQ